MAGEIQADYLTGRTLYAIVRSPAGDVYNTAAAAFEPYNPANLADYDHPLAEQGSSGYYAGTFPALPAGLYYVLARERVGPAPAESDVSVAAGAVHWDGAAAVALPLLSAALALALQHLESDEVIDTAATPWTKRRRVRGTATELLAKELRRPDGSDVTSEDHVIGSATQP